jgi:hypothetical protein
MVRPAQPDPLQPNLFDALAVRRPYPDGIPTKVCDQFEKLAFEVHQLGIHRYSADALLHRVRWHFQIEKKKKDFRCNNNWTAQLARWFMDRNPQMGEFFETRKTREKADA